MDSESLKIILELNEKNTLYRRAIGDIFTIISRGEFLNSLMYDIDDDILQALFLILEKQYGTQNKEKPSDKTDKANNS